MSFSSNKIALNSIYNFSRSVVLVIIVFVVTPLFIKTLTPAVYGIYVLINAIIGPLALFEMGIGEASAKFVAASEAVGDTEKSKKIISNTMLFNSMVALVGLIVILAIAYVLPFLGLKIDKQYIFSAQIAFALAGVIFVINRITGVLTGILTAIQDFKSIAIVSFYQQILYAGLGLLAAWLGFGLIGVIAFQSLGLLITVFLWWYRVKKSAPHLSLKFSWERETFKDIFKYGAWNTLGRVGSIIMQNVDKIVLGVFLGTAIVGYYNTAFIIYTGGFIFIFPLASVLMPHFSALDAKQDHQNLNDKTLFSTWLLSSLTMIVYIPFFIYANEFLTYWINSDAAKYVATPLRFLILAACISSLSMGLGQFVLGIGTRLLRYNTIFSLIRGFLSVILSIFLISRYGVIGAGIGVFISQFTIFWLNHIIWKKSVLRKINYFTYWRSFIQPLACGAISIILLSAIKTAIHVQISNMIVLVVWLFMAWIFSTIIFGLTNCIFAEDRINLIKAWRLFIDLLKSLKKLSLTAPALPGDLE